MDVKYRDAQDGWVLHRDVTVADSGANLISLDPGEIQSAADPVPILTNGSPGALIRVWSDTINKEIEIEVKTAPHKMNGGKPSKGTVLFRGKVKTSGSTTVNKLPIGGDAVSSTTFYEAAEEVAGHTIVKTRRVWFDPESGNQVAGYDMQVHLDLLDDAAMVVQVHDRDSSGRVLVGVKLV